MPSQIFQVSEALGGKTLEQLKNYGGYDYGNFRPEQLGIGGNTPLSAGQQLTYRTDDPTYQNEGEYQKFTRLFGQPLSTEQQSQIAQQKALTARQQAIAPAVSSLEASIPEQTQKFGVERTRLQGEVDPIKQRYQLVLDKLKRRETKQVGEAQTSLSREYGKRGIPLSSGVFDQNLAQNVYPITDFYGIQQRETGASQEENLRNITNLVNQLLPQETEANRTIRNVIANLQSGAGNASIEDAIKQLQMQEERRQFDEKSVLSKAQQETQRRLADAQIANYNKPAETDPFKQFRTLGEGQTLVNLNTGQPIYTAPKTYKDLQAQTGGGLLGNNGVLPNPEPKPASRPSPETNRDLDLYSAIRSGGLSF